MADVSKALTHQADDHCRAVIEYQAILFTVAIQMIQPP